MAWLPYSVRRANDRLTLFILYSVGVPHLLIGLPLLVLGTLDAWEQPEASWSGAAGGWTIACLIFGAFYLVMLALLLFMSFGTELIHISDSGVRRRRELFGWAWKESFYPAESITGWTWKLTFPWRRGLTPIKERSLSAYECRLSIQVGQRTSQPVLLTSRNGMDIASLCTALHNQWPNRVQSEPFFPPEGGET